MSQWICLVISLPTSNATLRQRVWRALKTYGAAVLRDGVYLLPAYPQCVQWLGRLSQDILEAAGTSLLLYVNPAAEQSFEHYFDRSKDYQALMKDIKKLHQSLPTVAIPEMLKHIRKLRKAVDRLQTIDFFPGNATNTTLEAMVRLEQAAQLLLSPDEPTSITEQVPRRVLADYIGKVWATRQRPWVDRLACAWLIRRFIDPKARILWLAQPADCPADALGFDFDGATFTHVGEWVSFEVMLHSFGLVAQEPLKRIGVLVHSLDVGGMQPPEAVGVEQVLAGLRSQVHDDDRLLAAASAVFDGLYSAFGQQGIAP